MNTEIERGGQKQTFTSLFETYLRRAVACLLKMEWEVVNDLHAAKFDNDKTRNKEQRAVCKNSKRVAFVAL